MVLRGSPTRQDGHHSFAQYENSNAKTELKQAIQLYVDRAVVEQQATSRPIQHETHATRAQEGQVTKRTQPVGQHSHGSDDLHTQITLSRDLE